MERSGNFFSSTFNGDFNNWAKEYTAPKQLIEITQTDFNTVIEKIDKTVGQKTVGLDDIMLKKMLLAYNTGKYSKNADIIIELTNEEGKAFENSDTLPSSFSVIQGKELEQLDVGKMEQVFKNIGAGIKALFKKGESVFDPETYEKVKTEKTQKREKYYLHTKGVLKFINEDGDELVYLDSELMDKIFEEHFQKKRYGPQSDYAESAWEYLSTQCYTDGENGIKMYGYEKVDEGLIDWTFRDTDQQWNELWDSVAINKKIIESRFLKYDTEGLILKGGLLDTAIKEYKIQDLEYYSKVSKYATPIEFMIDLLNISTSTEFVDAFIDKMTQETEVVLQVYKTSKSTSKEIKEVTNETTTIDCEAVFSAEIVTAYIDKSLKQDDGSEIQVSDEFDASGDGIKFYYEWVGTDSVKMKFKDIPSKYERLKVKLTFKANNITKEYYIPSGEWLDGDPLGTAEEITITPSSFFGLKTINRYATRTNTASIERYTTTLKTETQLDIAVKSAKTWYGTLEYNNYIKLDTDIKTLDASGALVKSNNGEPIMIGQGKPDIEKDWSDPNASIIFENKAISSYAWSEICSRVERWYANLKADNIAFWVVGGGYLTRSIYDQIDKDKGIPLSNENELLNIRYTYAMENGPADWWTKRWYLPVRMTCEATPTSDKEYLKDTGYAKGEVYETVDRGLEEGTVTVNENSDVFLSLLKNNSGKYNRTENYNPNGKLVTYNTVYNTQEKVGGYFETSAEMLFELLDSSEYTRSLVDVMRYILYQYTTQDYGVTEFTFETVNRDSMEYI